MSTEELARDFTAAVIADDAAAYQAFWADDIVSLEPGDGDNARTEGREALLGKHAWWNANAQVHDMTADGPYLFGDQFALRFTMDVTMQGTRSQMAEIGLYTVKDGKIAEERFLYATAP
jgi:ketosteroid isomerase-like protein